MVRYRVTVRGDGLEQTWVILPDAGSALTQAEEHARRLKGMEVVVYREESGHPREELRVFCF
jgi:hypothetical protein